MGGHYLHDKERFYGAGAVSEPINNMMFMGGGQGTHPDSGAGDTIESWDGKAAAWTIYDAKMPRGTRVLHAAASLGGKVYMIGGYADSSGAAGPRADVDVFDPATKTWSQGVDLTTPRAGAMAETIDGKIMVCGGCSKGNCDKVEYSCESFDGKTWTSAPPLFYGAWQGGMVSMTDNLWQIGGSNTYGTQDMTQWSTGSSWTKGPQLMKWRQLPAAVALTEKNQLWACGGAHAVGYSMNSCETLTVA